MKSKICIIALFLVLAGFSFDRAFAFTEITDGKLNEWGVTPETQWTPTVSGIHSTVEFQGDGVGPYGYLDPGYGGHTFDAEAMYAAYDTTNLYFAIVTGFPPTGSGGYVAGDVAFDIGADGTYEYGMAATTHGAFTQGKLYSTTNTNWDQGLSNWGTGDIGYVSAPTYMLSGTESLLQGGGLVYTNGNYDPAHGFTYGHYVIEGFVPISDFGGNWNESEKMRLHWTMSCGNDAIDLAATHSPEPTTILLLGLGLLGVLGFKKKHIKVI